MNLNNELHNLAVKEINKTIERLNRIAKRDRRIDNMRKDQNRKLRINYNGYGED